MSWVLLSILTACMLGAHQVGLKLASQYFHTVHASFFYLLVSFVCYGGAMLYLYKTAPDIKPVFSTPAILAVLFAGVTAFLFVTLYIRTFQTADSVSSVVLVVDVLAIVTTVVLSMIFFGETFTALKALGFVLALSGVALVIKG